MKTPPLITIQLTLVGDTSSPVSEGTLDLNHYRQVIVSAACKETPGGTVTIMPGAVLQSLPAPVKDALTETIDQFNQHQRTLNRGKQRQVNLLAAGHGTGGEGVNPLLQQKPASGKQVNLLEL